MNKDLTIKQWCELCHGIAKEKGFWEKDRNIGEALMLIVTELAEAMEGYRHQDHDNFREELADTFIRLFDLCGGLGIDLEKQIEWKMSFNKTREKLHGKTY